MTQVQRVEHLIAVTTTNRREPNKHVSFLAVAENVKQKTVKIPACKTESRYSEQLIRENIPARHDMHETFSVEIGANGRYLFFLRFSDVGRLERGSIKERTRYKTRPFVPRARLRSSATVKIRRSNRLPDPLSLDFLIKFI